MARAIIHIGYHKTATTWFQAHFYPAVKNARYIPRMRVRQALLDVTAFHFDPGEARRTLGAAPGETVAICEEGLSGYLHHGGLLGYLSKDMAQRIKSVFPDAQIVIFVRNQPSIIAASYQQYVKGGGTHSLRRYLFGENYLRGARGEIAKCPRFTFDHFDYAPLTAHYQAIFGKDNVHVFAYEAFRAAPAAFLKDFCARLGLAADVENLALSSSSNRSYGRLTMWIVRALNLFTNRTVLDKHYIIHIPFWYAVARIAGEGLNRLPVFGWAPKSAGFLGEKLQSWIEQRYWRGNAELKALTGLPLEDYGYALKAPDAEIPKPAANKLFSWMGN
jgi:hypothetical protein